MQAYNNATQRDNVFNQVDLTFTLNTGEIRHQLASATSINLPIIHPTTTTPVTFRQAASDADSHGVSTTSSLYLQDQITFTPQWLAIVGLRWDRFAVNFTNKRSIENILVTDTPISPRIGLVFKPITAVSFYVSYSL